MSLRILRCSLKLFRLRGLSEIMLTWQGAHARYNQKKAHPGKPGANAAFKACREQLRAPATAQVDEPGQRMVVTDDVDLDWAAYICMPCLTSCACRVCCPVPYAPPLTPLISCLLRVHLNAVTWQEYACCNWTP